MLGQLCQSGGLRYKTRRCPGGTKQRGHGGVSQIRAGHAARGRVLTAAPVHPTFLYMRASGVWLASPCWLALQKRRFNGQIFLSYIIWYGPGRAWTRLRTDSLLIGNTGLRASQLVAIGSVIGRRAYGHRSAQCQGQAASLVPLAVNNLERQAGAGDRFTADTCPPAHPTPSLSRPPMLRMRVWMRAGFERGRDRGD